MTQRREFYSYKKTRSFEVKYFFLSCVILRGSLRRRTQIMKRFKAFYIIIYLMTAVVMLCAELSFAQTDWVKDPGNPVLDMGRAGSWDDFHVAYPSVIFYDGTYQMWYGGYDGTQWQIGYATSNDGIHWAKYANNPVLHLGQPGAWDDAHVTAPSVIFDNSLYKMWYIGNDGITWRIGYATSYDGIAWTKYDGNPVLDVGLPDRWDDVHVADPFVIFKDGIYKMWYGGFDGTIWRIGYAESFDGIAWTRYVGNPVLYLGSPGTWDDDVSVGGPSIIFEGGIYKIWYHGYDGYTYRIGYAISGDGKNWTKYSGNPVLHEGAEDAWDDAYVLTSSVILDDGTYKIWYTGCDGDYWRIGYATSSVPSTTGVFTLRLKKGLNMISLPVNPPISYTAKSLADELDASIILKYDSVNQEFIPYIPGHSTGDGFLIEGGQGYIVNVLKDKQVTFTGTVWDNTPSAPNMECNDSVIADMECDDSIHSVWAFVVAGNLPIEL